MGPFYENGIKRSLWTWLKSEKKLAPVPKKQKTVLNRVLLKNWDSNFSLKRKKNRVAKKEKHNSQRDISKGNMKEKKSCQSSFVSKNSDWPTATSTPTPTPTTVKSPNKQDHFWAHRSRLWHGCNGAVVVTVAFEPNGQRLQPSSCHC